MFIGKPTKSFGTFYDLTFLKDIQPVLMEILVHISRTFQLDFVCQLQYEKLATNMPFVNDNKCQIWNCCSHCKGESLILEKLQHEEIGKGGLHPRSL